MTDDTNSLRRQMDQLLLDTQQAHRKKLSEIAEHQTEIQGELTELANKFLAHMEHEEGLVARATEQLTEHAVKISYLERMQYALWGAVGTLAASGAVWVVTHLSTTMHGP